MSTSAAERRAKQTVRNLIYSLLVTLALTLAIVMIVPRDDGNRIQPVDYSAITETVQASVDKKLIAPALATDWWVNAARVEKDLGVETWYVGYITPDDQYIGLTQAFESNTSWLANKLHPYGVSLEPGQVILGGSFTTPIPARAGDTFHVDYDLLGSIACRFV